MNRCCFKIKRPRAKKDIKNLSHITLSINLYVRNINVVFIPRGTLCCPCRNRVLRDNRDLGAFRPLRIVLVVKVYGNAGCIRLVDLHC